MNVLPEQPENSQEDNQPLVSAYEFAAHLAGINPDEVLQSLVKVPIYTWNYIWDDASVRHMGPMAQDFYTAFGLGINDRTIFHMDGMGVCMASVQALHDMLQKQAACIEQQQKFIDEHTATIAELERLIAQYTEG